MLPLNETSKDNYETVYYLYTLSTFCLFLNQSSGPHQFVAEIRESANSNIVMSSLDNWTFWVSEPRV